MFLGNLSPGSLHTSSCDALAQNGMDDIPISTSSSTSDTEIPADAYSGASPASENDARTRFSTDDIQRTDTTSKGDNCVFVSTSFDDFGSGVETNVDVPCDTGCGGTDNDVTVDWGRVSACINSGPPFDKLTSGTIQLTRDDLRSVTGKNWLYDTVINQYFQLIKERSRICPSLPRVTVLSNHIYITYYKNWGLKRA